MATTNQEPNSSSSWCDDHTNNSKSKSKSKLKSRILLGQQQKQGASGEEDYEDVVVTNKKKQRFPILSLLSSPIIQFARSTTPPRQQEYNNDDHIIHSGSYNHNSTNGVVPETTNHHHGEEYINSNNERTTTTTISAAGSTMLNHDDQQLPSYSSFREFLLDDTSTINTTKSVKSMKTFSTGSLDDEILHLQNVEKDLGKELENVKHYTHILSSMGNDNDDDDRSTTNSSTTAYTNQSNLQEIQSNTLMSNTPPSEESQSSSYLKDTDDFETAAEPRIRPPPPPPSPPSAFEQLFFGADSPLPVIAKQKNNNTYNNKLRSARSNTSESVLTEDFASATSETETNYNYNYNYNNLNLSTEEISPICGSDILGFTNHNNNRGTTILEQEDLDSSLDDSLFSYGDDQEKYLNHIMAKKNKTTIKTNKPVVDPPVESTPVVPETLPTPPTPVEEEEEHFDMIEHVYESAKSVWAFGKGIIVFSPFMGVAEGVAAKAISLVGVDSLEKADEIIKMNLISVVDKDFIDPAVLKLLEILAPVIGKGDDVIKSVVSLVSKKQVEAETETETTTVDVAPEKTSEEDVSPETSTPVAPVH